MAADASAPSKWSNLRFYTTNNANTPSFSLTKAILSFAAIALLLTYTYTSIRLHLRRRAFKRANNCLPILHKLPQGDPLGFTHMLRQGKSLRENRLLDRILLDNRTHGPTFSLRFFEKRIIATSEPENVKTILSLRFNDFGIGSRQETLGALLGKGIFTTDGEAWAHSRAMVRPNFTREQVADLDAFERHVQEFFKAVPKNGETVDLQELFFRLTIDSATEFLFGRSTGTLQGARTKEGMQEERFAASFNKAQHYVSQRGRLAFLKHFIWDRESVRAIKDCHEFVDQFVEEAVRYRERIDAKLEKGEGQEKERYTFLHQLARATKDKIRLRDELLNILLAGRDTTASLLSNMWFLLAKNPRIYEKLRAEIENTLNGEVPSYEQLRNLKYLKYCMNESLRIHPVVPANARIALRDTLIPLGGGPDGKSPVFVAKNTIVSYSTYVMHRRPEFFGPDPEVYRPERWETLRPGWEYLPFNGGPRICLGQQYALTEAGYVTVRLLQEYKRLECRDEGPWVEGLTLTVCSKNGVRVGLFPA